MREKERTREKKKHEKRRKGEQRRTKRTKEDKCVPSPTATGHQFRNRTKSTHTHTAPITPTGCRGCSQI